MVSKPLFRIVTFAAAFLSLQTVSADAQDQPMSSMSGTSPANHSTAGPACDDLSSMGGMQVMGASMGAMTNHMCITPMRPKQPGDEEKAKALVSQVRDNIEKYKDYKKALAAGFVIVNPTVDQPQAHFNNEANVQLAESQFDPLRPSALLYRRTPTQKYKLEGVMFTASTSATEDELNQRIPLSIARWHEHTNFCAAPADKVKDYHGDHPKFGMFGSVHTQAACQAEGGTFLPVFFTWMIHVFPYEDTLKDNFSMNDDKSHVR